MKPLYTIILEYNGGTYVSQLYSDNHSNVLNLWIELESHKINLSKKDIALISKNKDLDMYELVQLNGLNNIWCTMMILKKGQALFNIIKTCN